MSLRLFAFVAACRTAPRRQRRRVAHPRRRRRELLRRGRDRHRRRPRRRRERADQPRRRPARFRPAAVGCPRRRRRQDRDHERPRIRPLDGAVARGLARRRSRRPRCRRRLSAPRKAATRISGTTQRAVPALAGALDRRPVSGRPGGRGPIPESVQRLHGLSRGTESEDRSRSAIATPGPKWRRASRSSA